MIIVANRNMNLHTKSVERADGNGLVHVPARKKVRVPNDVADVYEFYKLVDSGVITVLNLEGAEIKRPEKKKKLEVKEESVKELIAEIIEDKEPESGPLTPTAEVIGDADDEVIIDDSEPEDAKEA